MKKIAPVPNPMFPTRSTLGQAISSATAQLPVRTHNQMVTILMTYHNTLLATLAEESSNGTVDHQQRGAEAAPRSSSH